MDEYYKYVQNKNLTGGGFLCNYKNNFSKLCYQKNGKTKYNTEVQCFKDCKVDFFKEQIKTNNIEGESIKFRKFIKHLINKENIDIYIRGGNALGLYVLKIILDNSKDDITFLKNMEIFKKTELIKDWDFVSFTDHEINKEYMDYMEKKADEFRLVPRAKRFILYQTKRPILTHDKALYEISVFNKEKMVKYSDLEMPLSTIELPIDNNNILYIFYLSTIFNLNNKLDLDALKYILNKLDFIVYKSILGYYDITKDILDDGNLSFDMLKFIEDIDENLYKQQFLITHIKDPYRLCFRLQTKNLPKTEKIQNLFKELKINYSKFDWLLNLDDVNKLCLKFVNRLGERLVFEYDKGGFKEVQGFLLNIDWVLSLVEYKKAKNSDSKYVNEMLNMLLLPLAGKLSADDFITFKDNKMIELINEIKKN